MFESAKDSGEVEDSSIAFPIISGILLGLKWGAIEDDEDGSYEQELVGKFIESARAHGDLAHVSRAIALKGVMLQRMAKWEEAVMAQEELEEVYVRAKHAQNNVQGPRLATRRARPTVRPAVTSKPAPPLPRGRASANLVLQLP